MADQKQMKKRLKVLMNRPENQICSDCPEKQPRWASLIVPPPGAPEGSLPIGAFCCLECSGSHRRLGVHISFVRSINLDSWKEKEVLAMENGGNAKVNALFEAKLQYSGVEKPSNHADGPTRERFIRDKYERRKFYDPSAFAQLKQQQQRQEEISVPALEQGRVGPPSDAATRRVEERRAARASRSPTRASKSPTRSRSKATAPDNSFDLKPSGNAFPTSTSSSTKTPRRSSGTKSSKSRHGNAPKPDMAPEMDLLDLMAEPAPAPASAVPANSNANYLETMNKSDVDLFGFLTVNNANTPNFQTSKAAPEIPRSSAQRQRPPTREAGVSRTSSSNSNTDTGKQQQRTVETNTNSVDIMSLYGGNGGATGGMQNAAFPMSPANTGMTMGHGDPMANMAAMMQQMTMTPQQQTQQPMQQQMFTPQQMMMMQQQMMMMQQQQMRMQQMQQSFQQNNPNMMMMMTPNNGNMMNNNNNMMQQNAAMGMPGGGGASGGGFAGVAPLGSGPPISQFQQAQQNGGAHDAGHSAGGPGSMNSGSTPSSQASDPFASFGANAFRS